MLAGVPFAGSSAGANVAGLIIGTTNDFPTAEIPTRAAFGFLPATINPHHPLPDAKADYDTRAGKIRGYLRFNPEETVLGLGNAATPFGIRAMQELDKLNVHKGTATDAMVMFLAINTANVTILPTGVIALRAAAGSTDPAGIVSTTLFATFVSTIVAILAVYFFRRWAPYGPAGEGKGAPEPMNADSEWAAAGELPPEAPPAPASAPEKESSIFGGGMMDFAKGFLIKKTG